MLSYSATVLHGGAIVCFAHYEIFCLCGIFPSQSSGHCVNCFYLSVTISVHSFIIIFFKENDSTCIGSLSTTFVFFRADKENHCPVLRAMPIEHHEVSFVGKEAGVGGSLYSFMNDSFLRKTAFVPHKKLLIVHIYSHTLCDVQSEKPWNLVYSVDTCIFMYDCVN